MGRHRAGKRARARNHLHFAASRSRWSCWSPEDVAASARAQHEDDVGAAMPAEGDTGGRQTRTVQGEVVSRSEGSGRRASGAGGAQRGGATSPASDLRRRSFQIEQLPGIATLSLVIARLTPSVSGIADPLFLELLLGPLPAGRPVIAVIATFRITGAITATSAPPAS